MTRKEIGSIKDIRFGFGGYQDAMFGVSVTLGGKSWGVGDFKGTWGPGIDSKGAKWNEADRDKHYAEMVRWIAALMVEAKCDSIAKMKGKPVEVEFDANILKSWRILTEVL